MSDLWQGARRLPYFFSYGSGEEKRAVLCPQCALEHADHDAEMLRVHYHVSRSIMCGRCGILIGPVNEEEMVEI